MCLFFCTKISSFAEKTHHGARLSNEVFEELSPLILPSKPFVVEIDASGRAGRLSVFRSRRVVIRASTGSDDASSEPSQRP